MRCAEIGTPETEEPLQVPAPERQPVREPSPQPQRPVPVGWTHRFCRPCGARDRLHIHGVCSMDAYHQGGEAA